MKKNDVLLTLAMVFITISGVLLPIIILVPIIDTLMGNGYTPNIMFVEIFTVCYIMSLILAVLISVKTYWEEMWF